MSPSPSWITLLDCTERGPRPTLANVVTVLQTDVTLGPAHIHYDTFTDRVTIVDEHGKTRPWVDEDDFQLTVYLQQTVGMSLVSDQVASKAVRLVARQRPRHCVIEWLDSLAWDGVERIESAFEDIWGVDFSSHPADYVRAVSRNLFLGMVARVKFPGCKLDTMPVFEGSQGTMKSSALEILASPPWFATARDTVGTKDFLISQSGKWLMEFAELDALARAEITQVKNTMSTRIDTYRPPYGRSARDYPRQCVFAGTTNKDDWATDPTGGRRFWPVRCGVIRLDLLRASRAQLFAEAYARVCRAEPWWITPDSASTVQRDRYADDVWVEIVSDWVIGKPNVTASEVLAGALKMRDADMTRTEQIRVGNILRVLGWKRQTVRRDGYPVKAWVSPSVTDDDTVTV